MLALKSSTRIAHRIVRSFATVVDSAGLKVASVDSNQPTASVTFLVNGGTRFETKAGAAHALKNFAFKSTKFRSALGTIRESELYGGVLSASLSREHLALTAEFLRGDEEFFVQLLSEFVQSAKFTRHEYEEYVAPVVESETAEAAGNSDITALELAHAIAFRKGLGASLFSNHLVTASDVEVFAKTAFRDIAVVGTGIDQSVLAQLVRKYASSSAAAFTSSPASTYFGGETRVEGHGPATAFIGFGATGANSADIAALNAYLSPSPSIKWSSGISPISSAIPTGTTVKTVYLPYSDATLFGFLVQGDVKTAGSAAVAALKAAAKGLAKEDFAKASAKARFAAASALETRDGLVNVLGSKVLSGSDASVGAFLKPFEAVTSASVAKAASAFVSGKPTYIAVGDTATMPYIDELGL